MIPPKKSKAARENAEEEPTENGHPIAHTSDGEEEPSSVKSEKKDVNIFTEPLVEGKRAKTVSAVDTLLFSWIKENLEIKAGTKVKKDQAYGCYLASCANKAINGVDQGRFVKAIDETFPDGHTIKESSAYSKKITEVRKVQKKKEAGVKGETLKIKMKDIITGALQDLGNPKNGIRFNGIKKYIAAHFPALQIDFKPDALKSALNRGVYYRHIILVKGIGKAGFYRLPGKAGDEDEEEKEKPAKEDKAKGEKTKEENAEEGDEDKEMKDEKVDGEADVKDEEAEGKRQKRKAATKATSAVSKDKKKKKKGKKAAPKKPSRRFIIHSDPQRVQDCFPLAFVYMAEPKQASVLKIRNYVKKYYNMKRLSDRLPKVLEDGLDKGWWSLASGGKGSGMYRLEMTEYDATADDDLIGMVMNALVACTEPKVCSSQILKNYITEYHPDLKVAERPKIFKKALLKAVDDGTVKQLTGIGMSGSFRYNRPFIASPVILQGADDQDDYDSDGNELLEENSDDSDEEAEQPDVSVYFDAYVPRPAKSRGHARTGAAGVDLYADGGSVSTSANRVIPKSAKKGGRKNAAPAASAAKAKPTGRGRPNKAANTGRGRPSKAVKETKEDKEEKEESKGPSKKGKRGNPSKGSGGKRSRGAADDDDDGERKTSKRSRKNVSYTEDADDADSEGDDEPEDGGASEDEAPSKSRRKPSPQKKSKGKKDKKGKGRRG